jgi:phosphatidylglycerophosphate synthase
MPMSTAVESVHSSAFAAASFGATILRLILALYVGLGLVLCLPGSRMLAVAGILLIMILDHYDGVLFKRSLLSSDAHWRVRRRILDSAADRVVVQLVSLAVVASDRSFLPFYFCIVFRELVLSSYVTRVFLKGILAYPGRVAKVSAVTIGLLVSAHIVGSVVVEIFTLALMLVTSVMALSEYGKSVDTFVQGAPSSGASGGCERIEEPSRLVWR